MTEGEIRKTVVVDAPPEVVFKALTDEKEIVHWMRGRPADPVGVAVIQVRLLPLAENSGNGNGPVRVDPVWGPWRTALSRLAP